MKKNPVIVFVTDDHRSQAFMNETELVTFGADNYLDALSETIFSYPDVIVIDASKNMLRADNAYFHLRTINHPPIILLSNVAGRWDTEGGNTVIVMPENSTNQQIADSVRAVLADETTLTY